MLDQYAENVERAPADRDGNERALLIPLEQHTDMLIEAEVLEQGNVGRGHRCASYAIIS